MGKAQACRLLAPEYGLSDVRAEEGERERTADVATLMFEVSRESFNRGHLAGDLPPVP